MPVSREIGRDLIDTILSLYAGLETRLAADIARELSQGMSSPDWAANKLQALSTIRRRTQTVLARLDSETADEITQALVLAYHRGGSEALREITRLQLSPLERLAVNNPALPRMARIARHRGDSLRRELAELQTVIPGLGAIQRLAWALTSRLRGTHTPILRWVDDVYRQVIAETSLVDALAGVKTRRRAAQVAWEKFLTKGVTGFVDKAGRRWELASYVEMATRTGVAQAAVEGHMDRLGDAGVSLVIVSDAPQECIVCRPWEGEVLARTGQTGRVTVEHALTGAPMTVNVAGTITQAVAAGLLHPNCRHSLSAYLPGVTRGYTHTADPRGDEARHRLRAMERRVREWKRREAGALTPEATAAAKAKVRQWQAAIREHVETTGLHRQRPREQIGTAR